MISKPEQKECPECEIIMGISIEDNIYYCLDSECGYTEPIVEEVEEEEEDKEFHCPHCNRIIDEEDLP